MHKSMEFLLVTPLNFYNQKLGIKSLSVGIIAFKLFIADYSIFIAHNSFKSFKSFPCFASFVAISLCFPVITFNKYKRNIV